MEVMKQQLTYIQLISQLLRQ